MGSILVSLRRAAVAAAMSASLAAGALQVGAAPVFAYGSTAVYQIEISANFNAPAVGAGVWLWVELDANGTGDYTGSDCGHGFAGPGSAGAVPDMGDVTWTSDGTTLTIQGVVLNGVHLPVTIRVPATYGHSVTNFFSVFGVPFPGSVHLQVAP